MTSRPAARLDFRRMTVLGLLLLAISAAIGLAGPAAGPAAAQDPAALVDFGPRSEVSVETARGVFPFQVEVADEPAERSQGLMYRRQMDPAHGMLFDLSVNRQASFWMKNTYVPLDIVFIREDGTVDSIAQAEPLSTAVIPSKGPVRFALELLAGTAPRIGLAEGDRVRHPIIDRWADR